MTRPVPVILDTDIGLDVDDVWALAFALNCPELDIRLITTATGDTRYRAAVVAKLLEVAGRQDIPIGVGIPLDDSPRTHDAWLDDYDLGSYSGIVHEDGVGALCDAVMACPETVTILCIGPLPNIAAALARQPEITERARFVGMHGSLRIGYLGHPQPMREYNVKQHALSARAAFAASWSKTITPLDTCGNVFLDDERFASLLASEQPLTRAVLDNHFGWFQAARDWPVLKGVDPSQRSSILFDCVAVYLAFDETLLEMEELPIAVTADGKTLIESAGERVRCATAWRDQAAFLDLLTARLT